MTTHTEPIKRFVEAVIRFRIAVLVGTGLITLALALQLGNLGVIIDPNNFLPPSHPNVVATNTVERVFGSKYVVVVGLTATEGEALRPVILAKVQRITAAFTELTGVVKRNVLSLAARRAKSIAGTSDGLEVRPLMDSVPRSPAEIERLKAALLSNPTYFNAIVSPDWRTVAVLAEFRDPPHGFGSIMREVAPIVERERDATVEIAVGGLPVYLTNLERLAQRMGFLFPIAVLVIGLIHYEAFRTRQAAVLPLVTALLAVVWGLGIMGAAGVPMDVFNATTPILILAVAAGHAVQILKRYYEEYHRLHASGLARVDANRHAVVAAVARVGPVTLTAGVAAAIAFLSLLVFEIRAIRTFGVFSAVGILSALVLELTFIPALRSMLPPPGEREQRRERAYTVWDRVTGAIADWVTGPSRRFLWTGAAALVVVAGFGASRVDVRQQLKRLFSPRLAFVREDQALNQRLGGTNGVFLLVEGKAPDAIKSPRVLRGMDSLQRVLEADPEVGKTISLADFVRRMNRAMNGDSPAQDRIPDSTNLISQYLLLYSMSGEPGDFDSYVDYDYRSANIWVLSRTSESVWFHHLVERIQPLAQRLLGPDVTVSVGGSVAQESALAEVMVRSKLLNMVQIGAVLLLIASVVFRSLSAGWLVIVPLFLTVLVNFGLMGLTGIPLNIDNSLTSAMVVGIGADYVIYLMFRLREELSRTHDETEAVRNTLRTAGKATLFVASAVAGGYAVLALSIGYYPHLWMAILIGTAMIVSCLTTLTLVPALLLATRPAFVFAPAGRRSPVAQMSAPVIAFLALAASAALPRVLHSQSASHSADPVDIMTRNYMVNRVPDSEQDITITLINRSGQQRIRRQRGWTKLQTNGIDNRRLVRYESPADVAGTATLLVEHSDADDDIWIYLPALRKVRRLVSSNKKESFVGTDFSYGDVIGHRVKDWRHTLVGEESVDGQACLIIESTPVNGAVGEQSGYSRQRHWIRADNFVTVRIDFWDRAGEPLKRATYHDIRLVDSTRARWQAMRFEAENLQTGHRTIVEFDRFKANVGVADRQFAVGALER
ncbi:MAG: outer membrane lipoprotein-sorting protein [Gemmatimonadota bacterium]